MARRNNRVVKAVWVSAAVAVVAPAFGAPPAGADKDASLHGVFGETAQGADLGYDIHGSVKMTIGTSGTVVRVNVSGLDPAKAYGSHLHNGACADGGGGHYKDDETGAVTPPNELWLTSVGNVLVPNPGGVAHGEGSATWMARISSDSSNARSVVVHEPGSGARIACADLQ